MLWLWSRFACTLFGTAPLSRWWSCWWSPTKESPSYFLYNMLCFFFSCHRIEKQNISREHMAMKEFIRVWEKVLYFCIRADLWIRCTSQLLFTVFFWIIAQHYHINFPNLCKALHILKATSTFNFLLVISGSLQASELCVYSISSNFINMHLYILYRWNQLTISLFMQGVYIIPH